MLQITDNHFTLCYHSVPTHIATWTLAAYVAVGTYGGVGHASPHRVGAPVRGAVPPREARSGRRYRQRRLPCHHLVWSIHHEVHGRSDEHGQHIPPDGAPRRSVGRRGLGLGAVLPRDCAPRRSRPPCLHPHPHPLTPTTTPTLKI